MSTVGAVGRQGFDSMKELAKEYPHKWSSAVLYRDYLRMIHRKYDEPHRSKYVAHVRNSFRQYGYIDKEMSLKLMGTGPTSIGSLAIEEEFYLQNVEHPEHPTRLRMNEIISSAMDNRRPHSLPYVMQRDLWYYFGLADPVQHEIATKLQTMLKDLNSKYSNINATERDNAREWLLNRLDLFEKTNVEHNNNTIENEIDSETTNVNEMKINEIFNYLDSDKDGKIQYNDVWTFLDSAKITENDNENRGWVNWVDNVTFYPESWYYMCDIIEPPKPKLASNTETNNDNSNINDSDNGNENSNVEMTVPPYETGWTIDNLRDAYLKFNFFDLEGHYTLLQQILSSKNDMYYITNNLPQCDRTYNLFCDVSLNVPSIDIIPNHALATGSHLYYWILHDSGLDEYDRVDTWDELEDALDKIGNKHLISNAKESEEILPTDIVYFDPETMPSDVTGKLPVDSIYWHVIFESKYDQIPKHISEAYWNEVVIPKLIEKDDITYNELYFAALEYNEEKKYQQLEDFVYDEMEDWMQKWIWERFTQMNQKPAFPVTTWADTHLRKERNDNVPKVKEIMDVV